MLLQLLQFVSHMKKNTISWLYLLPSVLLPWLYSPLHLLHPKLFPPSYSLLPTPQHPHPPSHLPESSPKPPLMSFCHTLTDFCVGQPRQWSLIVPKLTCGGHHLGLLVLNSIPQPGQTWVQSTKLKVSVRNKVDQTAHVLQQVLQ